MSYSKQKHIGQIGDISDPPPLTLILEIANLVIQPGSLALLASGATAAIQYKQYKKLTESKCSKIRGKLYNIDRALNDGFASLMTLASLLDQFNSLDKGIRIGGSPIKGFKNTQKLRRAHEDCRAAVKDTRDAFIELSELLPSVHSEEISTAIAALNNLYNYLVTLDTPMALSLIAATHALNTIDRLICSIGKDYDFKRSPRSFTDELLLSMPQLRQYEMKIRKDLL